MTAGRGLRIRRWLFSVAVATCLVRPTIALVEIAGAPATRAILSRTAGRSFRPEYLDLVRTRAPEGNLFLIFDLPPAARNLAALIYYQFTYDLYPRRVLVTDRPATINGGGDLELNARPDAGWLAQQGVDWLVRVGWEEGRLSFAVEPAVRP